MPLDPGKSKSAFSHNVATEINAGKKKSQAVAIAYSEAGEKRNDMAQSDFAEIKRLLTEFFSEEAKEPEHKKDAMNTKLDAIAERADSLQPNPWANKLAALNGGINSLTARMARKTA